MEDSLWSNYPELRWKCTLGNGPSNHERTAGGTGSRSQCDKISAATNFHHMNLRKNFHHERVLPPWNSLDITNDAVRFTAALKD